MTDLNTLKSLKADSVKSRNQLALNLILYSIIYYFAVKLFDSSALLSALPIVFLSFLLVRIFIIQHDCAHYSYWDSRRTNSITGSILSSLTHAPHGYWRYQHAYHHAHSGNLEYRDVGDIKLLTTAEFQSLSNREKLIYRLYRNPFVMVAIGGFYQFFIWFKLPISSLSSKKLRKSILQTNLIIFTRVAILCLIFEWEAVLFIEILSLWIASMLAIILFYVQHNYEGAYWCTNEQWNHADASLKGSSFLNLSKLGHWLTGNIGYHHIHHLNSKIPNYSLAEAHARVEQQSIINTLHIRDILPSFNLKLWDEKNLKLVGFEAVS